MVNKTIMFFVIIIFGCSSCEKLFPPKELSLPQCPYEGNSLRLDGYYSDYFGENDTRLDNLFLYRNGVMLDGSSANYLTIDALEERYSSGNYYNNVKNSRTWWGVFMISEDVIKVEGWGTSSGGSAPVFFQEGNIVNDSTFTFTESYTVKDGKKINRLEKNETYHFKKFSPKPDSTNEFTK